VTPTLAHNDSQRPIARTLLILAGVFFVFCAAIYNEWLVALSIRALQSITGGGIRVKPDSGDIHTMQLAFFICGAILIGFSWLSTRIEFLDRLLRRDRAEKITLALLVFLIPITALELSLRPFAPALSKETSLFIRDDMLGWRMQPNKEDAWGDIVVRTNNKGLRGPDIEYEKPAGVRRILYLGDSVTFGWRVARYQDTYPFVVESLIADSTEIDVETVNTGVGGYSPWQQYLYLDSEGIKFDPDLVVLSFVLNDVTEKFELVRYGGSDESNQIQKSYYSRIDRFLARSGLAYQVQNITRKIKARRRLGEDLQLGAIKQQTLEVETLITHPDQDNVQLAWQITLENVAKIADFCAERDIAFLLVVFPFKIQVYDGPGMAAPQKQIISWADEYGVTHLDLLPILDDLRVFDRVKPERMFLDEDHLTVRGHKLCARAIADKILETSWLNNSAD
jgi:lysophospholipase L1-like esterase